MTGDRPATKGNDDAAATRLVEERDRTSALKLLAIARRMRELDEPGCLGLIA
jgi:hypothetical protein